MALDAGRKPLADILENASKKGGLVNGADAFLLYDTYGFPLEITLDAAADQGLQVNLYLQTIAQTTSHCSAPVLLQDASVDEVLLGSFIPILFVDPMTKNFAHYPRLCITDQATVAGRYRRL